MNTIQNISLGFDYTKSKSIPISLQSSKNYNGNKYHQKEERKKKKNFDSPRLLMPSLSIFNSPLRYFLHPSKAAVIINESLPVLSALCMRALRLKAEGNGGWAEGEGLRVTHVNTHTASQGHWPTPKKPKILIAPSPISLNLDIVLLTQMGTRIRQSVELVGHLQSQWA